MTTRRQVSATRFIAAPPEKIFDLLADPRQHHALDGSATVQMVKKAPERLYLGATFVMDMKIGRRYETKNTVVAFEENRTIAWHHWAQFTWRYDLEAVEGGTRVTETFNYDRPWGLVIMALGWPERNRRAMERTLERIERVVTSS